MIFFLTNCVHSHTTVNTNIAQYNKVFFQLSTFSQEMKWLNTWYYQSFDPVISLIARWLGKMIL